MRVLPVQLTAFVAALLMVGSVGCGKETVLMVAPVVTAVTPANGATGVVPGVAPTATFSVAMNPTTINASTFTLSAPGGVAIVGSVAYNAATLVAVFTPAASLAYNTTYTATVTTGVMDTLGDETARNSVWSFTTATQPTVSWPTHCDRPVPDMPTCRQRLPSVSRRRVPPLRLRFPFQSTRAHHLRVQFFHDPHIRSQQDKLSINVRLIYYLLQRGMWIILDLSACTGCDPRFPW